MDEICTDCGEYLDTSEEVELGVCEACLKRIRKAEGRCPECGEWNCTCPVAAKGGKVGE